MKTLLAASAVAAMALAAAGAAGAQSRAAGPSITLYELPNFQGQARNFTASVDNLANQGFNDRAQSMRVQGRWRICEDARLRGRCVEISGDIPNLADLRMTVAVSSFEFLGGGFGGRPPGPGGPGFGPGGPGPGGGSGPRLDGRSASFFPDPGPGFRNADEFCRRMGFSGAAYADDRGRDLRDVLCRR